MVSKCSNLTDLTLTDEAYGHTWLMADGIHTAV